MIDYENVHGDGLEGCQDLTKTDHIVIFFTQNAKSIDMRDISNHGQAELEMIEVPSGKQSADIHISSYIGFLAGKNGKNCNVVIVSKDTDFDKVLKFWKEKVGITASRKQQIKKKTMNKTASNNNQTVPTNTSKKTTTKVDGNKKTGTNSEIQKALSNGGFSNDIVKYVASTAVKNLDVKNGKQQTYRSIISKYGQDKGLNIYNHIKKHI